MANDKHKDLTGLYPPAVRGRIIVWGLLASYPFGGMTWQVLHYLAGLRRLGFDVWYVEDSDRYMLSAETYERTTAYLPNVEYLSRYMNRLGLDDRWVFRPPCSEGVCYGARDLAGLKELYRQADAVINLCGAQELREEHSGIACLIYVETDPVENQVYVALGDQSLIGELDAYKFLFTYGENLGADDCPVPMERYRWYPTRPPVCVDWWDPNAPPAPGSALTTVANWMHAGKDVVWRGETWHWSKHLEFKRFINLPSMAALPLELAVGAISEEELDELHRRGWRTVSSGDLKDPDLYRAYIRASGGEFTASKERYVRPRSGWFSDRSVCYLAAGRPVVTQETGFGKFIPTGEGLFSFSTEEEAVSAIAAIVADYTRHSSAAREIAREYFATDRVLTDLMSKVGLL
jgi:hypothetical protein